MACSAWCGGSARSARSPTSRRKPSFACWGSRLQLASAQLFHGKGCADCQFTGYRGRLGIYEIFQIDDQVRNLVFEQVSSTELRIKRAGRACAPSARTGCARWCGITTLEEVLRVTMGDQD